MIQFRPFKFGDSDYQLVHNIRKAVWPDTGATIEGMRHGDDTARKEEKYDFTRTVAELDGRAVGYGQRGRTTWSETPNQYYISFNTHPDFRNQGVATAFFDATEADLKENKGAQSLLTFTRDTQTQAVSFLENRGYEVIERITNSKIDLSGYDLEKYAPLRHKLEGEGIEIRPLSELMDAEETYLVKLEELHWVLALDEPHAEPPKRISLDEFKHFYIDTPHFYPDGWFIATDGDKFVGWSAVLIDKGADSKMQTGITVIDRSYRRRGLATAMKIAGFEHAIEIGRPLIQTENEETNPMLELNKRLGFKVTYQGLDFKKIL